MQASFTFDVLLRKRRCAVPADLCIYSVAHPMAFFWVLR